MDSSDACRSVPQLMPPERTNDSRLLERFVRENDSGAFRDLVYRYGPGVLRVCRAVLDDQHEAEDAFQATFLVLVRKAATIQDPASLGGWLRGVARFTALEARSRAARRRVVEKDRGRTVPAEYLSEEDKSELRQIVRDEVARLPDSYRQPVMLCFVEGLTHEEAAQQLGWPIGTVKVRLSRARRLLSKRIRLRKLGLGAALLLILRECGNAEAAVPEPLVDSTVRAMTQATAGRLPPPPRQFRHDRAVGKKFAVLAHGLKTPWLWAILVLASILAGLGVSAVVGSHAPPAQGKDNGTFMKEVVDILTHPCP